MLFCYGILVKVRVLVRGAKEQNCSKVDHVQPPLRVCEDFLVVVRKGCGLIGGEKIRILDPKCRLR